MQLHLTAANVIAVLAVLGGVGASGRTLVKAASAVAELTGMVHGLMAAFVAHEHASPPGGSVIIHTAPAAEANDKAPAV